MNDNIYKYVVIHIFNFENNKPIWAVRDAMLAIRWAFYDIYYMVNKGDIRYGLDENVAWRGSSS